MSCSILAPATARNYQVCREFLELTLVLLEHILTHFAELIVDHILGALSSQLLVKPVKNLVSNKLHLVVEAQEELREQLLTKVFSHFLKHCLVI